MDAWDRIEQAFFDGAWDASTKLTRPRFGIKRTGASRIGDAADIEPATMGAFAAGMAAPYAFKKLDKLATRAMGSGFAERKAATTPMGKLLQAKGGGAARTGRYQPTAGRSGVAPGRGGVAWPPRNAASRVTGRSPGGGRPVGRPVRTGAQAAMTAPRKGTARAGVGRRGPSTWPVH